MPVLLTELKAGMNAYLAGSPAAGPKTLADLIAFNKANAAAEMPLFGQETFEEAEKTKGLADPAYKKARANSLRITTTDLDRLLKPASTRSSSRPARRRGRSTRCMATRSPGGNAIGIDGGGGGLSAPDRADGAGARAAGGPELHRAQMVGRTPARLRPCLSSRRAGRSRGPTSIPAIEASPEIAPALEPQRR